MWGSVWEIGWLKVSILLLKEEICDALLASKLRNEWTNVTKSTVQSGFFKAGIVPKSAEQEKSEYTNSEESDNELSDILPNNISKLIENDSEELDFEGFH